MLVREIRVGECIIGVNYLTGAVVYVLTRWNGGKLGPLVDVYDRLLPATLRVLGGLARAETGATC